MRPVGLHQTGGATNQGKEGTSVSNDGKIEALRATEIFRGCSEEQLEAIANVTEWVTVHEGHALLKEGRVGHDMFVFAAGTGEVQVGDSVVATVGAGDVVGELGLVDGQRSSATVTAGPGVEGWLVPRRGFAPILEKDPSLAKPLLDAVIAKLRATDERLH